MMLQPLRNQMLMALAASLFLPGCDRREVPKAPNNVAPVLTPEQYHRQASSIPHNPKSTAKLGVGWNSVTGEVLSRECVEPLTVGGGKLKTISDEALSQKESGIYQRAWMRTGSVKESVQEENSASVAARFNSGVFNGGFSHSSYRARAESSFTLRANIFAEILDKKEQLDVNGLRPISLPSSSQFRAICGDHLIVAAIKGARLHATLEQTYSSSSSRDEIQSELQAAYSGIGGASGEAAVRSVTTKMSQRGGVVYEVVQMDGGSYTKKPSITELADALYAWPHPPTPASGPDAKAPAQQRNPGAGLDAARQNFRVVEWIVQPYEKVFPGFALNSSVPEPSFFREQFQRLKHLQGLADALEVINETGNRDLLGLKPDAAAVTKLLTEVKEAMAQISLSVQKCGVEADLARCESMPLQPIEGRTLALPWTRKLDIAKAVIDSNTKDDPYINEFRVIRLSGHAFIHCFDKVPGGASAPFFSDSIDVVVKRGPTTYRFRGDQTVKLKPGDTLVGFDAEARNRIHAIPHARRCDNRAGAPGITMEIFTPLFPELYKDDEASLKVMVNNDLFATLVEPVKRSVVASVDAAQRLSKR